jgi:hypothetical protein
MQVKLLTQKTNEMRLTAKAITEIKNNKAARARLALALNKTEFSVIRWLDDNKANNPLTTVAALKVIKKETGLRESEILEELTTKSLAA